MLFWAPHTCALASHIALEEAGAGFSLARIFGAEEPRKPAYLAIHPKGRVPARVTERATLAVAIAAEPA